MATVTYFPSYFRGTVPFFLIICSVASLSIKQNQTLTNNFLNPLTNPCAGRGNGKVRSIDVNSVISDCSEYIECVNDQQIDVKKCGYGMQYFNAETEECVGTSEVCFRCPTNTVYELVSVPHICTQFVHCFNGLAVLGACPGDLVFDGRPGIHQCNRADKPNQCYRENKDDFEYKPCPPVSNEPKLEVAEDNQSA